MMTSQRPTSELNDHHTMSVIEGIVRPSRPSLHSMPSRKLLLA